MSGHSSVVTDDCTDLAALEAGDKDAFARLYDRHAAVVLSFCRRGAGASVADSEDAMQETFIRAHAKLQSVDDCRGFRKWLLQIASFAVRERRRSNSRYAKHVHAAGEEARALHGVHGSGGSHGTHGSHGSHGALEASGAGGGFAASSAASGPAARAAHAEDLARLGQALDRLPEDERLAIHIQYIENDPVTAAASAFGLSRSGYYKLLARARTHLAQLMGTEVAA